MLKISRLPGTSAITGKVASTTGTAPRSPAQPSTIRSRLPSFANTVAGKTASGRATAAAISASTVPWSQMLSSWCGNTSRPSVRNMPTWATHASPWWNAVIVCWAGIAAEPSASPAR